jgi:hypothetical protein
MSGGPDFRPDHTADQIHLLDLTYTAKSIKPEKIELLFSQIFKGYHAAYLCPKPTSQVAGLSIINQTYHASTRATVAP